MDKRKPFGEALDLKAAVAKQAEPPKDAAEQAAFDELTDALGITPVDPSAARVAFKDFMRACSAKSKPAYEEETEE